MFTPPTRPQGWNRALAFAVYTRSPSVAEPQIMPPSTPPGPAWVIHWMSPVSRFSTQYCPLFCPAPTTSRRSPIGPVTENNAGPSPKSRLPPDGEGQFSSGPKRHATFQESNGSALFVHCIAPVVISRDTMASNRLSAGRHAATAVGSPSLAATQSSSAWGTL